MIISMKTERKHTMKFVFGKRDFINSEIREESCYLMTNGLGGFSSLTIAGSCNRNDHAVLMSCQTESDALAAVCAKRRARGTESGICNEGRF